MRRFFGCEPIEMFRHYVRRPVVTSFRVPDLLPNEPGRCGGLKAAGRRGRWRESLFSLPKGDGRAGGRGCRLPKTKRANERRLDTFTIFLVPLFRADIQFQTFGVGATPVTDTAPRARGRRGGADHVRSRASGECESGRL